MIAIVTRPDGTVFASVPIMDSHISLARMMQLRAEAVIVDETEAGHIRDCDECRTLLRRLAKERSNSVLEKESSGSNDDTFSKSA